MLNLVHVLARIAVVTDLGKRGPAAGIIVILATQRVDATSVPTGISSNAVLRVCLKVAGQVENDMVLGTSMYKAGIRARMFARTDQGIGHLAGEGAHPVIVRTAYLDALAAESIVVRARAARVAAGLLTGHAAGIEPDPDPADQSLLDRLLENLAEHRRRAPREGVVGRPRYPAYRDLPRPLLRLDRSKFGHKHRSATTTTTSCSTTTSNPAILPTRPG
jgi:hypothetical protein